MKSFKAKSVIISRKPGKTKESHFSAFIGLFDENNPHMKGRAPFEVVEIKEIEKVRIFDLRNVSFYLMGNDIVINNLLNVKIEKLGNVVTVTGEQDLPDAENGA